MKKIILLPFLFLTIAIHAQCWQTVSLGADFCVAIKEDGTLWGWGHNESGQLGIGSIVNKNVATRVGTTSDWSSVSAGYGFTVALKTDGTLWVWGRNDFGLGIGSGTTSNVPVQVGTETDWELVSAGGAHAFAIKTDGTLWGWGRNDFGQIGIGNFSHANAPVQVGNNTDWKTVTAGNFHSLATKTSNTLWSWGYNYSGQLGQGTAGFGTELNIPTQVTTIPANQWKCIAAGGRHSLAITEHGNLWVWGNNGFFALGLNDGSPYQSLPTRIDNTNNWAMVSGGANNTLAVKEDHTLWGWGENTDGQLGDGTNLNRVAPVQVDVAADWLLVDSGLQHSIFLKNDDLHTSGANNYGELGIGSSENHNTLQSVACPGELGLEQKAALPFAVYPNPANTVLHLQNTQQLNIDRIQIIDGTGRIVSNSNDSTIINVTQLAAGWYWLQITSGKERHQIKFIKG